MGSAATALRESSATVSPPDSEIAAVAYQLWLESGCPVGSDQEDWFRAEAILNLFRGPSIPWFDAPAEPEMLADLVLEGGEGHWEIWEREWACAHWVGEGVDSGVAVRCYQAAA